MTDQQESILEGICGKDMDGEGFHKQGNLLKKSLLKIHLTLCIPTFRPLHSAISPLKMVQIKL
jgi:hypothetical protein